MLGWDMLIEMFYKLNMIIYMFYMRGSTATPHPPAQAPP